MARQRLINSIAAVIFIAGCMIAAGWIFDVALLRSFGLAGVEMKFSVAVSFVCGGVLLYCVSALTRRRRTLFAQAGLAAAAFVIFLLMAGSLVSLLTGIKVGIEDMIVRESSDAAQGFLPGVPSLGATLAFLIAVFAGLTVFAGEEQYEMRLRWSGIIIAAVGLSGVLGNLIALPAFAFQIPGISIAMAPTTSALFVLLGVGFIFAAAHETRNN